MVRQIPKDIGEKLVEQGKAVGTGMKQAPKTIFQRVVGEKTDEEKKADKERREAEEKGIEDVTSSTSQQQPQTQADLRRKQIETEKRTKQERLRKILHKRVFNEAEKVRRRKEEEERLKKMEEEREKQEKQEKKVEEIQQKKKEEALAVKFAKRAKGAGEFGPRKPK